jgi:hypothetical protein
MTDESPGDEALEEVERRLQALAREQSETVSADVAERLAAMRRQAVAELEEEAFGWSGLLPILRRAVPVTATVFAIAVVAFVLLRPDAELGELPLVSESEVAIVQDMELLEELEFLAWLEEESQGAG